MEKVIIEDDDNQRIEALIKKGCGEYPTVCEYVAAPSGMANVIEIVKGYIDDTIEPIPFHFYLAQLESYLTEIKTQ